MSYYFAIVGTRDNPLFEFEFGTSKHGGDGVARFRDDARHLNPFIVHGALDLVDELQWASGAMFLRHVDRFQHAAVAGFLTAAGARFLLLHAPDAAPGRGPAAAAAAAPPPAAADEATRQFFGDVYEAWIKAVLSPFYNADDPVRSPIFRARVAAAARKYL